MKDVLFIQNSVALNQFFGSCVSWRAKLYEFPMTSSTCSLSLAYAEGDISVHYNFRATLVLSHRVPVLNIYATENKKSDGILALLLLRSMEYSALEIYCFIAETLRKKLEWSLASIAKCRIWKPDKTWIAFLFTVYAQHGSTASFVRNGTGHEKNVNFFLSLSYFPFPSTDITFHHFPKKLQIY